MMQNCQCHQNPSSERNFFSSTSYPYIFGYLIPALIGIVGANVQGTNKPLIKTHAASLLGFVIATIFYCLALTADFKFRLPQASSSQFWGLIAVISGSLSSLSLVSTFVPGSTADIILCIAWVSAAIIIVVHRYCRLFQQAIRWIYLEIFCPFFSNIWNWFKGNMLIEQQLPPV